MAINKNHLISTMSNLKESNRNVTRDQWLLTEGKAVAVIVMFAIK